MRQIKLAQVVAIGRTPAKISRYHPPSSAPSSPMTYAISLVNVCLLGVGVYIIKRLLDSKCSSPLPPGPTGWPVIGNLLQISTEKTWEDFAALGRKYGMHLLPII